MTTCPFLSCFLKDRGDGWIDGGASEEHIRRSGRRCQVELWGGDLSHAVKNEPLTYFCFVLP